jgi:hypothetical protein
MPDMPAVCDNCGIVFPSGIYASDGATAIALEGNSSQCPVCGHWARVPDGIFNFLNNTIEVVQAPDQTIDDLSRFGAILRDLRARNASVDEVQEAIRQEASQFASLADLLPRNRAELYAFLALIIAAIQALQSATSGVDVDISDVNLNVDSIVEITVEHQDPPSAP